MMVHVILIFSCIGISVGTKMFSNMAAAQLRYSYGAINGAEPVFGFTNPFFTGLFAAHYERSPLCVSNLNRIQMNGDQVFVFAGNEVDCMSMNSKCFEDCQTHCKLYGEYRSLDYFCSAVSRCLRGIGRDSHGDPDVISGPLVACLACSTHRHDIGRLVSIDDGGACFDVDSDSFGGSPFSMVDGGTSGKEKMSHKDGTLSHLNCALDSIFGGSLNDPSLPLLDYSLTSAHASKHAGYPYLVSYIEYHILIHKKISVDELEAKGEIQLRERHPLVRAGVIALQDGSHDSSVMQMATSFTTHHEGSSQAIEAKRILIVPSKTASSVHDYSKLTKTNVLSKLILNGDY